MSCRHCGREPMRHSRGLCRDCYFDPVITRQYPSISIFYSRSRDFNGGLQMPQPTATLPRTSARMEVLAERVQARQSLHHPLDAQLSLD